MSGHTVTKVTIETCGDHHRVDVRCRCGWTGGINGEAATIQRLRAENRQLLSENRLVREQSRARHQIAANGWREIDRLRAENGQLREQVANADKPAPCDMRHQEPYDFAHCVTHDTTFALGDRCKWGGVESIAEKLQDEADEQRRRAVRAEHEMWISEAELARYKAAVERALAECDRLAADWRGSSRDAAGVVLSAVALIRHALDLEAGQ